MKILLFDIETAPSRAYMWKLWQEITSMDFVEKDWFILCWSAKWLDQKKIYHSALPDFSLYKREPENDSLVLEKLWKLLDEADIVIAHNGIKFDRRKVNSRFMINGMKPPSPYRIIDTLFFARKEFAFTSNKLNDIVKFLKIGKKVDTGGFKLWTSCLDGNKKAWKTMVNYCKYDIILLEKVYLELRPYMTTHPNMGIYTEREEACCPKCGSEEIHFRGYSYTNVSKFHRFVCTECGGWGRSRTSCHSKEKNKSLLTNAQ